VAGSAKTAKVRLVRWIVALLGLAVLFYFVPLFHVAPLRETREQSVDAAFDAAGYVENFWNGPLLEASREAVDAAELLAALQKDPSAAAKRYGHRLGLGASSSYLVSGQGQVVAVDDGGISIALSGGGPPEILIETGPVFGNAIRDGSGLINVSDFANAQDFNALSAEINRRVEEQVMTSLVAKAAPGAVVHFVGGVELSDSSGTPAMLTLVPVVIEFP